MDNHTTSSPSNRTRGNALDLSLYYVLDLPASREPLYLAESAIEGGVTAIQLRGKRESAASLYQFAQQLQPLLQQKGVALIINDRLDVALAVGADGVHLGKDDLPLAEARRLAPSLHIGISCYDDLQRARDAVEGHADYIAFGAFYVSESKPEATPVSIDILPQAKTLGCPIVAIGGITPEKSEPLWRAGVDGVAVISAIQNAEAPDAAARSFRKVMQKARFS